MPAARPASYATSMTAMHRAFAFVGSALLLTAVGCGDHDRNADQTAPPAPRTAPNDRGAVQPGAPANPAPAQPGAPGAATAPAPGR